MIFFSIEDSGDSQVRKKRHQEIQVPKMEESSPKVSCMDTAYVREFSHPQNNLTKGTGFLHYEYLKLLVEMLRVLLEQLDTLRKIQAPHLIRLSSYRYQSLLTRYSSLLGNRSQISYLLASLTSHITGI